MSWKKELHGWVPRFVAEQSNWPNFTSNDVHNMEVGLFPGHIYGVFRTKTEALTVCSTDRRLMKVTITLEEEEPITYMKRLRRKLRNVVKAPKN